MVTDLARYQDRLKKALASRDNHLNVANNVQRGSYRHQQAVIKIITKLLDSKEEAGDEN